MILYPEEDSTERGRSCRWDLLLAHGTNLQGQAELALHGMRYQGGVSVCGILSPCGGNLTSNDVS